MPDRISGQRIDGVEEGGVRVYRSIQYAAPPVGELRCALRGLSSSGKAYAGVKAGPAYIQLFGCFNLEGLLQLEGDQRFGRNLDRSLGQDFR